MKQRSLWIIAYCLNDQFFKDMEKEFEDRTKDYEPHRKLSELEKYRKTVENLKQNEYINVYSERGLQFRLTKLSAMKIYDYKVTQVFVDVPYHV
jgi:hypothetical protein